MKFTLELTGEQVHTIRMALMRSSNQAYLAGNEAKSLRLDRVEDVILEQIDSQRFVKETV